MDDNILHQVLTALSTLDHQFEKLNKRFDEMDQRFDSLEEKVDTIERKVDAIRNQAALNTEEASRLNDIEQDVKLLKKIIVNQ
ncbi:hypothetical protein [Aneurinibacillus tyrosinisolvens]|uniref:hypothetical protein n=1 Tax=Aneurinibacillus tyrosinisolvens TaxID=1443435 RepID=UPI00063F6804|nr:hypothetical protein [Aneurinibacillus tyrosinisolvens]